MDFKKFAPDGIGFWIGTTNSAVCAVELWDF